MMRGGNRQARRMFDRMGIDMKDVPGVLEVLIKTDRKEIVIAKPQVAEMVSKESSVFTITADSYEERELEVPVFSEEDVQLVCDQAGVDAERAKEALAESDGELARAIMLLKGG